jgi:hypothetical protein
MAEQRLISSMFSRISSFPNFRHLTGVILEFLGKNSYILPWILIFIESKVK